MRLIDANALIETLNDGILNDPNCPIFVAATVEQDIYHAPTVDAELVRHGRWSDKMVAYRAPSDFPEHGDLHFGFQCSLCKAIVNKTKYCGNCGARMDGGAAT